jgi:hypothetical protein
MKNFLKELNNKPLSVKLPLILIFGILIFFIISSTFNAVIGFRTQNEIQNLNFKVTKNYFETKNKFRSYFDTYVILELASPVTNEQFENLSFDFSPEKVRSELISSQVVKLSFQSTFEKSSKKNLYVKYKGVEIYKLFIENSEADKSFFESFPPDSPFDQPYLNQD